jgi:ABC-type uncharacterized transport system involved in gliding motility auxiliary subunit
MKSNVKQQIGGVSRGAIALLALFVILAAANVIVRNLRLRADLTQENLYSLSEGTRNMLSRLDQPVTLKLFFSASNARVPSMLRTYAKQVEDLLAEYRIAAKGNIIIQKLDPEPDSDEEEWARKYGIAGQALEMFGPPLYFGLVASAGSVEAVLPGLDPNMQQMLEFNISRMIHQVVNPKKTVVGVISSLPVLGAATPPFAMPGQPRTAPQPAWVAFQELRKDCEVREIANPGDGIPADVDVLAIVHPKALSRQAQFAIDQHVLRGGRAVVFVDPMSVADQDAGGAMSPYGMPQIESDLPELFKAWGVGYEPSRILADFSAATPMRTPDGGIENNATVVTYDTGDLGSGNIMTAGLKSLRAAFAGTLQDKSGGRLQVTPLIAAAPQAGSVTTMDVRRGGGAVRDGFTPAPERQYLAMQFSGLFKTAFPEGKPGNEEGDPAADAGKKDGAVKDEAAKDEAVKPAADAIAEGESVVIVVADVDMLFDPICVEAVNFFGQSVHRPLNDNLAFFANMIDSLAGGSDLINIRSRTGFNRPFTRVDELETKAVNRWREQEAQLEASLREAQQQINQLQAGKEADQRYILSDSQREAIARFKQREFEIRQQLKDVRRNLRSDIERLGVQVKTINIALLPLLVGIGGILYGTRKKRS